MGIEYRIVTDKKFDDDFRKLIKKCLSLEEDFERLKKVLLFDLKRGNHRLTHERYHQIPNLGGKVKFPVFKVKKFRCKKISKGNRSGFRFIFILSRKHNVVYFVECYHKNKKKNADIERIKNISKYFESHFL